MIENICFSGGAKGADYFFGNFAKEINHKIIHYSFKGHKSQDIKNTVLLNQQHVAVADELLSLVNKNLKRTFPTKSDFVNNLLRRNYYQIIDSDSLYAISSITNNVVDGGTSWAVEMFKEIREGEIYIFDKKEMTWKQYNRISGLYDTKNAVPMPSGKWTGIGSRDINKEIEDALD